MFILLIAMLLDNKNNIEVNCVKRERPGPCNNCGGRRGEEVCHLMTRSHVTWAIRVIVT
jgi:hypothetical protein